LLIVIQYKLNNKRFNCTQLEKMLQQKKIHFTFAKLTTVYFLFFLTSCKITQSSNTVITTIELSKVQAISIIIFGILAIVSLLYFLLNNYRSRKQREEYKSYESRILNALIDNMPDFIYVKDTQSRFILANKHTAHVVKAESPNDLIGKTDFDFYPKKMAQKFFKDEQKIIKTRKPLVNIEEDGLDIQNNKIIVSTTKVPWIDEDGKTLGTIGIGRDVTKFKEIELKLIEQAKHLNEINTLLEEKHEHINHQTEELTVQSENLKHLNDELHKINETKDKFISIIAHDLKNPFNAIINFSELLILKADSSTKPNQMEMMHIINSSSKMAYSLLENLLYWGKSQSSTIPFRPIKLDISDIISEVVEFLEVSAMLKDIIIVNDSASNLFVFSDQDMVTTILRNLLSNAIKFTDKNGQIKISSSIDHKFGIITVTDNGIGIPENELNQLFKSDKEITKGTSGESGTGLGLLLCKEFALKNGGDILVKSEPNKGSSFILSLPLTADF